MANIEIKRGQQTQVDITYTPTGSSYATNFYTSDAQYTASLVIRKKSGTSVTGDVIDTLTSNTSGSAQHTSGRIRFPNIGSSSTSSNIMLRWETADAVKLPNETITVYGDLKITNTDEDPDEVIHSFRLTFDIIPEIV